MGAAILLLPYCPTLVIHRSTQGRRRGSISKSSGIAEIFCTHDPLHSNLRKQNHTMTHVGALLCVAVSSAVVSLACQSDVDCSHLGICSAGACACEPPFAGLACTELALVPRSCGAGGLCSNNTSNWGGGVVQGDDGLFHMYSALMDDHCELSSWLTNSRVLHATSKSMAEPF